MGLIRIKCPLCGRETDANDDRSFCFCTECGGRFELNGQTHTDRRERTPQGENDTAGELEAALKEVSFYYELSREKQELAYTDRRPEYYEKAQEKLLELSKRFPAEYKVWWELCKPLDYFEPEKTIDYEGSYGIGESSFNKALDLAPLDVKRDLVAAKDSYNEIKGRVTGERKQQILAERQRREALERQEAEARAAEEARRRAAEEEARIAAEARAAEEAQAEQRRQQEAAEEQRLLAAQKRKEDPAHLAVISLACGILTYVSVMTIFLPIPFSIAAIVCGWRGRKTSKRKLALIGLGLGISFWALGVIVMIIGLTAGT